jgi:hypothetical protein
VLPAVATALPIIITLLTAALGRKSSSDSNTVNAISGFHDGDTHAQMRQEELSVILPSARPLAHLGLHFAPCIFLPHTCSIIS